MEFSTFVRVNHAIFLIASLGQKNATTDYADDTDASS
jgi:hypothetical protein